MSRPTRGNGSATATLKDFQLDTVDYAVRRLYDDRDSTDRFLVADEVGMGKTLVARGVIEQAIERLQDDDRVDRIDIIYICSNADIARQNIDKLDVTEDGIKPLVTRITMLATQQADLNRAVAGDGKTVNLIALTPGTSFAKGLPGGRVEERALLSWLLEPLVDGGRAKTNALRRLLQMGVERSRWDSARLRFDEPGAEPDPTIVKRFRSAVKHAPVFDELAQFVDEIAGRRRQFDGPQKKRQRQIVAELRRVLATASVDCLEPDLIILDEFQRFRHLLNEPDADDECEVSQLANDLFNAEGAKVLLLSATPYRMFTLAEERGLTGDDHYRDFFHTVEFLERPRLAGTSRRLRAALDDFRRRVVGGGDPQAAKDEVERLLRRVMCRTERPVSGVEDMILEKEAPPDPPTPEDLLGFVALKRIADHVGAQLSVEYWKSAPYFLNFMDGYQLSKMFHAAELDEPTRQLLLRDAQVIRRSGQNGNGEIDPANSRFRRFIADTLDQGLWKLLWLPPSMPYHRPEGAHAEVDTATATKRLVFSSWAAAPSAIASLLSDTATRRMQDGTDADAVTGARLTYGQDSRGRPAGMSTLALFSPAPKLADLTDPLAFARESPDRVRPVAEAVRYARARVKAQIAPAGKARSALSRDTWFWAAPFAIDANGRHSDLIEVIEDKGTKWADGGLRAHLSQAERAARGEIELGTHPPELAHWVALVGLAGPANVAWRALRRVTAGVPEVSDDGVRRAAAVIAAGFRSLFNRPEVMALLDGEGRKLPYWQSVLQYCLHGNLQAVLDEYLHHLVGNHGPMDDQNLLELANDVRTVISLRVAPLQAVDPVRPGKVLHFNTRFALRYGSARGRLVTEDGDVRRRGDVQAAFNSPFWPMVLASTSVGQEGIDFHWWCHSIVHWNLPANPADFEQREGRVHRFKGHAVRKNVASAHRADALRKDVSDPWRAAFASAEEARPDGQNDLWPWWTYPGDSKIERWIPSFPLSRDEGRKARLERRRALYRLAFGQPRQEDLIALLEKQGYAKGDPRLEQLRIDLRPPKRRTRGDYRARSTQ